MTTDASEFERVAGLSGENVNDAANAVSEQADASLDGVDDYGASPTG